jgi:hypothetical protein
MRLMAGAKLGLGIIITHLHDGCNTFIEASRQAGSFHKRFINRSSCFSVWDFKEWNEQMYVRAHVSTLYPSIHIERDTI